MATLLDGGQHRIAGNGSLTIGKTADGDIVGYPESGTLRGIHDADGCIVVDSKKSVRAVVEDQDLGGDYLCIGSVITDTGDGLVERQTVFEQRILIAVKTVLGNLQLHGRSVEGDALATRLNQMGHGIVGTHIVVDHHSAGIHTSTDAVVEHQGDACIDEFLIVVVILGVFCLRDDHTTALVPMEILADADLAFIFLTT